MSSRSSRRIRLYERQKQWELELIPEKDEEEDDFARHLDCLRRGVVNTVSTIFKVSIHVIDRIHTISSSLICCWHERPTCIPNLIVFPEMTNLYF